MKEFKYFKGGTKSEGHTPIYKMHKYFARRPHNVFKQLIECYSPYDGIIVDCFGGGGVTLVEGLTASRRVISYDVNPIACFVQYTQLLNVDAERIKHLGLIIQNKVKFNFSKYFQTECRKCKHSSHVRWYEHAYIIKCQYCSKNTNLSNDNKKKNSLGKDINGHYSCLHCKKDMRSSDVKRIGSEILNLRYRCSNCGTHETAPPTYDDHSIFSDILNNEIALVERFKLEIPEDEFPSYWDRQKEDCLFRKGFCRFRDLFTIRNLIVSSYYFTVLEDIKEQCSSDEYFFLLMNISALLRYTNNMTFCVKGWMDGRPVAWAKHAYWTPNQFIECNPIEYFDNRLKASLSGIKDRNSRQLNPKHGVNEDLVLNKIATHTVLNQSSVNMNIPSNSVDVVITDPPYGSNVQYGELCHFWLVWIKSKIPFKSKLFDLSDEVIVHRKKDSGTGYAKGFLDYELELAQIFKECFRVLKIDGCLTFTFNNKNAKAWYAVIKAALDAGFYLDAEGITYQEQIEAYRDTAHLRFEGTIQGDFIYTFRKQESQSMIIKIQAPLEHEINILVKETINELLPTRISFTEGEIFISVYKKLLARIAQYIKSGVSEESVTKLLDFTNITNYLENIPSISRVGNQWNICSTASHKE